MKCYRISFQDDSALLVDAENESEARRSGRELAIAQNEGQLRGPEVRIMAQTVTRRTFWQMVLGAFAALSSWGSRSQRVPRIDAADVTWLEPTGNVDFVVWSHDITLNSIPSSTARAVDILYRLSMEVYIDGGSLEGIGWLDCAADHLAGSHSSLTCDRYL